MHNKNKSRRSSAGMTLVEIMVAMTIVVMAVGGALSVFLSGLKMMYKDSQRLENNRTLRSFLSKVSAKAVDSTEFYLLTNYASIDGSIDLSTGDPASWPGSSNIAAPTANAYGSNTANGDCLVLISRTNTTSSGQIYAVRVFYRYTTSVSNQAPLRMYEMLFAGGPATGTTATVNTVLNSISINRGVGQYSDTVAGTAVATTVVQLADKSIGRIDTVTGTRLPIFAAEVPYPQPVQENVSINVEVINGINQNDKISSSSFNYIISPRK